MITVKVTYDNGDYTVTGFNGTLDEAVKYFLSSTFNLGTERDDMHRCVKVELLENGEVLEVVNADGSIIS